jgi:hypothetical protein
LGGNSGGIDKGGTIDVLEAIGTCNREQGSPEGDQDMGAHTRLVLVELAFESDGEPAKSRQPKSAGEF